MRIAKAPVRISFAGGGTDVDPYRSKYGGLCLAVTIQKYCFATYSPKVNPHEMNEMEKAILNHFNRSGKLLLSSEVPPLSGLGGSAAACVAGVKAISAELDNYSVAELAVLIERKNMGILGGIQDQYESACGGLNLIRFLDYGTFLERISVPKGLEERLFLVWTGARYMHQDLLKDQIAHQNKSILDHMKEIVVSMSNALGLGLLDEFGRLMRQAWEIKKRFSPLVTDHRVNRLCGWALNNGAIAGKLCGAGGGGFMVFLADPDFAKKLVEEHLLFSKVKFDLEGVRLCTKKN